MATAPPEDTARANAPILRIRDLSPAQWKSGVAAWLGWLFDGLDMHLYSLVALPFVAELLGVSQENPLVGQRSAWIQGSFLLGWALGGGFFGRIGDRLGRSRALMLTILTYALFTGLSYFAQTWWHLMLFRFLAALGIGGEWAVGASLLSETWPARWRPWIAAVLQTAVNLGVMLACLAGYLLASFPNRCVFLVGVVPAFLVLWIRRAVPEPEVWHAARAQVQTVVPGVADLFRGSVRRITLLTIAVCSLALTAHWAFTFWCLQHLRSLPEVRGWSKTEQSQLVAQALLLLMVASIVGNFVAAWVACRAGYRKAIVGMCLLYFVSMVEIYRIPRDHAQLLWLLLLPGLSSGLFGLFTMYMPPLFPVLLRTTGAGFCYNIGRIVAAFGAVFFGLSTQVENYRTALFIDGFLFLPAALVALFLPEPPDEGSAVMPLE